MANRSGVAGRYIYGNCFPGLIGKTVEMAGKVETLRQPIVSIRIVDHTQIRVVVGP
jgi:hypothetical protein